MFQAEGMVYARSEEEQSCFHSRIESNCIWLEHKGQGAVARVKAMDVSYRVLQLSLM